MNGKDIGYALIDEKAEQFSDLSHEIWGYAELSLQEKKSAAALKKALDAEGVEVACGICGIETAFTGTFSNGPGPVIGILGEFDALSGLSQKAGVTEREELVPNGSGHGCGHNMLGVGSIAAACAVKAYMQKTGLAGTVIYFGCPGEEGGASKAFMARERIWEKLDAAISWHPGSENEVTTGTNNSCVQILYKYKGVAAHAAGNPEDGRSALDAVELMNIGVQYLREHMKKDASIHYAIIDGGGVSPNVVQPHASVLYMIRSRTVPDTLKLMKRVDLQAEGAALMTETTYERVFVDGTADTVPNTALEKAIYKNMQEVPLPAYTDDEKEFAAKLAATYPAREELPGRGAQSSADIAETVEKLVKNSSKGLNDFLLPFYTGNDFEPGSTDVGDVSHLTPTAQFTVVTFPKGCPGHSWQNVSSGGSSVGDKGMLYAAKVLFGTAVDLLSDPELLKEAKEEFRKRTVGKPYVCPIPDGVKACIVG